MDGRPQQHLRQSMWAGILCLTLAPCCSALAGQGSPDQANTAPGDNMISASGSPELQGDTLSRQHRYLAAIAAYKRDPQPSAVVWNKMGVAYHHMFALDQARFDYEMALRLDPRYPEAWNNLGAVYHGRKQFKQAEHAYKRAIKFGPHSAVSYGNLGTTYFAERKYKDGIRAYQKALAVDPKVFDPAYTAAIEEQSSAEQRIATNYCLAKVYATSGRPTEAMESLRKAILAGFRDKKRIMQDSEFASLRGTTEFQQLIEQGHLQ